MLPLTPRLSPVPATRSAPPSENWLVTMSPSMEARDAVHDAGITRAGEFTPLVPTDAAAEGREKTGAETELADLEGCRQHRVHERIHELRAADVGALRIERIGRVRRRARSVVRDAAHGDAQIREDV
jgi:hypothetical protein